MASLSALNLLLRSRLLPVSDTELGHAIVNGDRTEDLMTLYETMDPPQQIDDISDFPVTDGWAKGPKIDASSRLPIADWTSILPNGSARIDVRLKALSA